MVGHLHVERAAVALSDLQRVDADLGVMGDRAISDGEGLAAEQPDGASKDIQAMRTRRSDSPAALSTLVSVAMRKSRVWPGRGCRWWPVESLHPSFVVSSWRLRPGR